LRLFFRSGLIDTSSRGIISPGATVDFWVLADTFYPAPAGPMNPDASTQSPTLLEEIDAQQDELLDQLDALNTRIERVLKECALRDLPLDVVS
jgi:hypothetical protein